MEIEILNKFMPIIELAQGNEKYKDIDTIVVTGGRNSFKSYHVTLITAMLFHYYKWKVLFSRYTWASAKDSIIEEIKEKINLLNIDATILNDRVVHNNTDVDSVTNPQIVFKGIKTSAGNQTANLKSLKGFNCFVTDEAEEQPYYKDWKKVKRSLRRHDLPNVAILVLNPTPKTHWIYTEFFEKTGVKEGFNGIKDNVLYIHSIYTDKLKWVTKESISDFEKTKYDYTNTEIANFKKDKSIIQKGKGFYKNDILILSDEYKFTILGGFRNKAEGVIFNNWEIGEYNENFIDSYGLDFGVTDPDSFVKIALDKKNNILYVKELIYENGLSTNTLISKLEKVINKRNLIIADSSSPRTIKDIKDKGFNIKPSKKGKNSVVAGIKKLKNYKIVVDSGSLNMITEFNNYTWADKKGEYPIDEYNHSIDAIRYALELLTKKQVYAG